MRDQYQLDQYINEIRLSVEKVVSNEDKVQILKNYGLSKVQSAYAMSKIFSMPLDVSIDLIHNSVSWKSSRDFDESIIDLFKRALNEPE